MSSFRRWFRVKPNTLPQWIAFLALIIFQCTMTHIAVAGNFYLDTLAGTAFVFNASETYGSNAASIMKYGLHSRVQFAYNFSHAYSPLQFNLGIEHNLTLSTQTASPGGYTLQMPYLVFRMEALQNFLSFGVGKWGILSPGGGFSPLNSYSPKVALLVDIGTILPITPEVGIVLSAEAQTMLSSTSGNWGPMPILGGSIGLRFYYGAVHNFNKRRRYFWDDEDPSQYPGYRYPYGRP